jgi:SNF2 family DNA or RNA helicase
MFCTSVQTLDILQDYLSYRRYTYERLDGSVRGEERYMAVERFTNEETFVFLLSTRAGGVGLNLTVADTVIFVDSDWNPQVDLQAAARVHRIGQKKNVLVVRLVTANTVEEIILRRTLQKLKMTQEVLEKGQFNLKDDDEEDDMASSSASDLQNILQYGLDRLWDAAMPGMATIVLSITRLSHQ